MSALNFLGPAEPANVSEQNVLETAHGQKTVLDRKLLFFHLK